MGNPVPWYRWVPLPSASPSPKLVPHYQLSSSPVPAQYTHLFASIRAPQPGTDPSSPVSAPPAPRYRVPPPPASPQSRLAVPSIPRSRCLPLPGTDPRLPALGPAPPGVTAPPGGRGGGHTRGERRGHAWGPLRGDDDTHLWGHTGERKGWWGGGPARTGIGGGEPWGQPAPPRDSRLSPGTAGTAVGQLTSP